MIKRLSVLIVLLILLCGHEDISARTVRKDTLSVYFEQGYSRVDTLHSGNAAVLDSIFGIVSRYSGIPGFHISVIGAASPDGTATFNRWLSERRTQSFVEYIESRTGRRISSSAMDTASIGVDWDGFVKDVEDAQPFQGQKDVLDIMATTPLYAVKKPLMDLERGNVFRYMMDNIFPLQRRVSVAVQYSTPVPVILWPAGSVPRAKAVYSASGRALKPEMSPERRAGDVAETQLPFYRMALKTNLLADIALMPSLEVEYMINDSWSVAAHGAVAWWSNDPAHKYYQISTIYPEARWWFRTVNPWHGHYLGLFAGGSWYDLENGGRGYKGEGGFVGLSYGYMFPISKCLSFEAGIGLGYLYTKYEEYEPVPYLDGTHYVYQQTSAMNYFGPLKLKFALVWRLWKDSRKGGAR